MPPHLALLLCAFVTVYLLRLTTQKKDGLSSTLWIPTLWMLYCGSRPVSRWFVSPDVVESAAEAGSPLDQIVLGALILSMIITLYRRELNWLPVFKRNPWLLVLFGYMFISIFWAPYLMVSFRRWIRAVGGILAAAAVMSESQPERSLETIFRRTAYVLLPLSMVLIKYFPHLGVEFGRWYGQRMPIGVCTQKNVLGLLCLISIFFLLWSLWKRLRTHTLFEDRRLLTADVFVLLLGIYLIQGAGTGIYSATAIGVLLIGTVQFLFLSRFRERVEQISMRNIVILGILAAFLIVSMQLLLGISPISILSSSLGRDETLTGRTDIWNDVFAMVPRYSLLGTGYGGFWGLSESLSRTGAKSGHNGYLDVYVELGLCGAVALASYLIAQLGIFVRKTQQDFEWGIFAICLFLMSLIYNYTESDFLNVVSPLWTVLLMLILVFTGEAKKNDTAEISRHVGLFRQTLFKDSNNRNVDSETSDTARNPRDHMQNSVRPFSDMRFRQFGK
jgi:exopolysaccharide production protein ExoQ